MANIKSATKAHKQSLKRQAANKARTSELKTTVKKLLVALEQQENEGKLNELLSSVASQLSRARSKKVLKANTASRTLSRLARKVSAATRPAK